jgi:HD-GYP domain-containing protein (c-di-GMP phosphodiesterase class II)
VIGPERVIAFTVSAPVQRHGELLGVYQEIAVLQRAWEEAGLDIQAPTKLFLLRADGSVIRTTGTGGPDESAQEVRARPVVQHFVQQRGRFRGTSPYTVPGPGKPRPMLGGLAATAAGWGVLVEVDESIALAPVTQMSARLRWGAILAAVLAFAVALVLRAVISRPITRLAQISKRLADGDFSVLAAPSRVTELDLLGVNFNRMAARLGELVERFRSAAREANDMFLGTIRALAEAIDEKDPYTKGHSVRVNRYAVIIGRYLGLSREEMRHLQISSLLHDVGKIGIDDAILKKPAALSPEEFSVMKTHPERGAKIMGRIPQMRNIIPGMRFHHERYSGGGYPLGLQKEEIPLQARIISVADTLDAMITDRPYQKALPVADAVARINDLKGRMLDPQVVEAFNRAFEAGEFDDLLAPPTRPDVHEPEPTVAAGRAVVTEPGLRPTERRP